MNKLLNKYLKLIYSGKMTKSEINGMKKALGACSSLSNGERLCLLNSIRQHIFHNGGIKIEREHSKQGISYLKSIAFKKDGSPRNTKDFPFGERELSVLKSFKYFRLVGLEFYTDSFTGNEYCDGLIWEVVGRSGSFQYTQSHWSLPKIVG